MPKRIPRDFYNEEKIFDKLVTHLQTQPLKSAKGIKLTAHHLHFARDVLEWVGDLVPMLGGNAQLINRNLKLLILAKQQPEYLPKLKQHIEKISNSAVQALLKDPNNRAAKYDARTIVTLVNLGNVLIPEEKLGNSLHPDKEIRRHEVTQLAQRYERHCPPGLTQTDYQQVASEVTSLIMKDAFNQFQPYATAEETPREDPASPPTGPSF